VPGKGDNELTLPPERAQGKPLGLRVGRGRIRHHAYDTDMGEWGDGNGEGGGRTVYWSRTLTMGVGGGGGGGGGGDERGSAHRLGGG